MLLRARLSTLPFRVGVGSYPITHAVMIHGLDVQLGKPRVFKRLRQHVAPLLEELGVELIVARS